MRTVPYKKNNLWPILNKMKFENLLVFVVLGYVIHSQVFYVYLIRTKVVYVLWTNVNYVKLFNIMLIIILVFLCPII